MFHTIGKWRLIAIGVSVLWFTAFSVIAIVSWNNRENERTYLYEQCLEQSPDVEKCRSLSQATRNEALGDVAVDFVVTGVAPIVVLWLAGWVNIRVSRSRRAGPST
jgi:hypothetical protein